MGKIEFKRFWSMLGLKLKKNAPTIMTVTGVCGVIGGTILACKASYNLKDKIEEGEKKIEDLKIKHAEEPEKSDEECQKEIAIQTGKNALDIAKMFAVPAAIEIGSVALLIGSHGLMQRRISSMAAAYATLDTIYKKYRKNVREQFGDDVDKEMRFGVKHSKVEEEFVDEEGNKHVKTETVDAVEDNDPNSYGDYCKFFDSSCPAWEDNPEYNLMFLKSVQNFCNDKLKVKGYMFLNDVYKEIGIEPTIAGQSVGWIYDEKNPIGDNYIDFGIFNSKRKKVRDFVNGYENVILLDFNVDGDILHSPLLKIWSK